MTTHFLTHDFCLADLPDCVDQEHYDNFADALRQCDITDDALQGALDLQHELGTEPCGTDKKRLQDAWRFYYSEQEQYEAMVQEAMEMLNNDHPYGFDH